MSILFNDFHHGLLVPYYLYIDVNVSGNGFSQSIHFKKVLYDPVSDERYNATTWSLGSAGTHGGNAGFILQALSEGLDGFILEYLRVNEAACD